jgi:hypothetical protein
LLSFIVTFFLVKPLINMLSKRHLLLSIHKLAKL